jgi:hypothetical protein
VQGTLTEYSRVSIVYLADLAMYCWFHYLSQELQSALQAQGELARYSQLTVYSMYVADPAMCCW